jgi:uncharacterized protein
VSDSERILAYHRTNAMNPPLEALPGAEEDWLPVQAGLFEYPLKNGQEPALLASCCRKCCHTFFPARRMCRYCLGEKDMEQVRLAREAIIYAATVVYIDSPAGIKAPYAIGYVDIPANGMRVFALFSGQNPAWFKAGQHVELVLEEVASRREQKKVIGYKYRPLLKGRAS